MSEILIRRSIAVDASDAADEFVAATADVQVSFLVRMAIASSAQWPEKCGLISDEMTPEERRAVAECLRTLWVHLRRPCGERCEGTGVL